MTSSVHQGQEVLSFGSSFKDAVGIVILLHGRGATANSMLPLAEAIEVEGIRFLIPQAALNRWYPETAFGPLEANEPDLSSALMVVNDLIQQAHLKGFSDDQIYLGGFSQGACLAAEFVVRNPRRYGGLFVLSGGLIGPQDQKRNLKVSLHSMPVFVGGSDVDPWISLDILRKAAEVFRSLKANVDFQIYPGMAHTVNQDEFERVRDMLRDKGSRPV
jgi:predicted esterase